MIDSLADLAVASGGPPLSVAWGAHARALVVRAHENDATGLFSAYVTDTTAKSAILGAMATATGHTGVQETAGGAAFITVLGGSQRVCVCRVRAATCTAA